MCELCDRTKENGNYSRLVEKMTEEDGNRLEFSKPMKERFSFVSAFSSVEYPAKLVYPMFEARMAYAVPHNYYQQLSVNGNQLGAVFSHGSMRSLFFAGKRLILFSKSVSHSEGREFFNSFLLMHFGSNEYRYRIDGENVTISADIEKKAKNLLDGKTGKIRVRFNFINQAVRNRIVSRERVLTSAHLRTVYDKYSALDRKMASVDMEGYAITVPHFSPHPYMLQLAEELGYASGREMQEKAIDYFRAHLRDMQEA